MRVEKMTFVQISPASATWDCADVTTLVCTPTVEKMIYNPEKASMNKTSKLLKIYQAGTCMVVDSARLRFFTHVQG